MAGYGYPGGGFNMPPSNSMFNFQPPTYNPLAGPGLLSNPMTQLAMAMYLPQVVGQGNFLPSLTPSQHLFDQYAASKYQNSTMQGRKMVQGVDQQVLAGRILGMQSMVSDKPPTAMNVEQAQNMAGIINDPLAKMFIGAVMGPEKMEDMFFGRRGSQDMLYSSVAKTGFFQRDPATGGQRMSAASLAGTSKEMYAQMYGPQADLGEMNGLSAGRAGMLHEDLFRRGLLPQSLGNMSASDRVKAIAENRPRDEATMDRLSREFTTQKLLKDDKEFKGLTVEQQKRRVDENLSAGRTELEGQFKEIEAYNSGRPGAGGRRKSIGEIEELEGFGVAARSVDAKKASDTLKNYSGAVAAIREIFGANGNPNAPMQQLMAGLEALTQNSVGQMTPGKVEGFVRRAQMASTESGIGLEAMVGVTSQLAAYGDTLGLNRAAAPENMVNAMNTVTAMKSNGMFTPAYGRMTPEEAVIKNGQRGQAADASRAGLSLAVAARFVAENPDKFKGTELESMVSAYNKGESKYTFDGKEVDITESVGARGSLFAESLIQKEGVSFSDIVARTADKDGTREFQNFGYARRLQDGTLTSVMGRQFNNMMQHQTGGAVDRQTSSAFSQRFSKVLLEDIDNTMTPTKRRDVMKSRANEIMLDVENERLAAERPDLSPAQRQGLAKKNAAANFESVFGKTDEDVNTKMGTYLSLGGRISTDLTGQGLEANRQSAKTNVRQTVEDIAVVQKRRAALMQSFGGGQSNFLQRISDVVGSMGSGDKKTAQQAIEEVLATVPTEQMEDAMRPGVGAIMQYAAQQYKGAVVTTSADINRLHADAKRGDQNALKKLQSFAGPGADKITDPDELQIRATKESAEKVRDGGEAAVKRAGAIYRGLDEGGTGIDRAAENISRGILGESAAAGDVDEVTKALFGKDEDALRKILAQKGVGALQIDEAVKMSQGLVSMKENDISLGGSEEKLVARARQNTVKDIVTKDNETELMKTREGRRLVAMRDAKSDGGYEYDYGDGKMVSGNVAQESAEEFRAAVGAGVQHTDQKTKDAAAKAFETTEKKADDVKKESAAASGTAPAKEQKESRGFAGAAYDAFFGTGSKAAGAVDSATAESGRGVMSGGISSANITIQNLENLYVQNATGMNVPADVQKKVDATAAGATPKSADDVAAGIASQKDKKKTDAVNVFDAALKQLGTVAENSGLPLRGLLDNAKGLLDGLKPADKKVAEEAVAGANDAAKKVVAATSTTPKDPKRQKLESNVTYAEDQVIRANQAPDEKTRQKLVAAAEQRLEEAKGRLASHEEHGDGATAADTVDTAARQTNQEVRKKETAAEEKTTSDTNRTEDNLREEYAQDVKDDEETLRNEIKDGDDDFIEMAEESLKESKTKLRVYDIAKDSGIPWDPKKQAYKTVGDVPININGRDVDPAVLTEEELENVVGATQISGMMRGKATPEEAARLKQYQEALVKKKADNTKNESQSASATTDVAGNVDTAAAEASKVREDSSRVTGGQQRPKDALREEYVNNIETSKKQFEAASKNEDPEIRAEMKDAQRADIQRGKNKLRAYDIAKDSGIPWDPKNQKYKTVGNVPININGRNVNPAALTEEELKTVIGATQISGMMRGEATPEEAARLKQYQEALVKKKADNTKNESQSASATTDVAGNVDKAAVEAGKVRAESSRATGEQTQTKETPIKEKLSAQEKRAAWATLTAEERTQVSFVRETKKINDKKLNADQRINAQENAAADFESLAGGDLQKRKSILSKLKDGPESILSPAARKFMESTGENGDAQIKKDAVAAENKEALDGKQDKKEAQQQQKQTEVSLVTPQPEERQNKQQEKNAMQSVQAVAQAEMQQRTINSGGGGGGGGGENETNITGTLQLRGLSEVLMAAKGKQLEETPENGAPVDLANATSAYIGS